MLSGRTLVRGQETCILMPALQRRSYVTQDSPLSPSASLSMAVNNMIPKLLSRSRVLSL